MERSYMVSLFVLAVVFLWGSLCGFLVAFTVLLLLRRPELFVMAGTRDVLLSAFAGVDDSFIGVRGETGLAALRVRVSPTDTTMLLISNGLSGSSCIPNPVWRSEVMDRRRRREAMDSDTISML